MHDEMFQTLLKKYHDNGHSLSRVITDPIFKQFPLPEKVELLKKYGHVIRANSKMDTRFWKDIGIGSVGTAIVLADPIKEAYSNFSKGYSFAEESASKRAIMDTPGVDVKYEMPELNLSISEGKKWAVRATGAGLATPALRSAMKSYSTVNSVKKLLKPESGKTTQEDVISLLARSE